MANRVEDLGQSGKLLAQIVYSYESNGSVANTSGVSGSLQIKKTTSTATTGTWKGYFKVGSQEVNISYYGSIKNSWVTVATLSDTILHNDDGTGSFEIDAEISAPSGTSMEGDSLNGYLSIALDTIPRKTIIGDHSGIVGSVMNISFNPASDTFLHTLKYSFGSVSERIVTQVKTNPIPWTPSSDLYAQFRSSKSGTGTLTLYTYDANGNLIGESSATLTLNANESACLPEITGTNSLVDINDTTKALTGDANILVKGYSNGLVTFNALVKNLIGK